MVRPVSTIYQWQHLIKLLCFDVWGQVNRYWVPLFCKIGVKFLYSPPLSNWKFLMQVLNTFSTYLDKMLKIERASDFANMG